MNTVIADSRNPDKLSHEVEELNRTHKLLINHTMRQTMSSTQLLPLTKEQQRPLKILRNDPEYQDYQKQRDMIEQRY